MGNCCSTDNEDLGMARRSSQMQAVTADVAQISDNDLAAMRGDSGLK